LAPKKEGKKNKPGIPNAHSTGTLSFLLQGPVNFVCLHCVNPSLRPLSMAMCTVATHLFGDVPSSPLVGVLQVCLL